MFRVVGFKKCIGVFSLVIALAQASEVVGRTEAPTGNHQNAGVPEKDIFSRLKRVLSAQGSSVTSILMLAFLAGLLTSFTPCVYPMIPVTAGILRPQAATALSYNFLSALSYVVGIALVYACLGYVSATTSVIFGQWLSNPFFIFFIVLFFLYFAFAMFGFYAMYIPRFLRRTGEGPTRRSLSSSFLFGLASGLVASPCLTPALAVLLTFVAKLGNPILGFFTLFSFSLGLGVLLILVGTVSGSLALLPRSGEWMDELEMIFGFLMLGVCIYFLETLIGDALALQLYAGVLGTAALYYFFGPKRHMVRTVVGILLSTGAFWLVGRSLSFF